MTGCRRKGMSKMQSNTLHTQHFTAYKVLPYVSVFIFFWPSQHPHECNRRDAGILTLKMMEMTIQDYKWLAQSHIGAVGIRLFNYLLSTYFTAGRSCAKNWEQTHKSEDLHWAGIHNPERSSHDSNSRPVINSSYLTFQNNHLPPTLLCPEWATSTGFLSYTLIWD